MDVKKEEFEHINNSEGHSDQQENQESDDSDSSSENSQTDSENLDEEDKNKKGRGRPKGSKNKKTIMKEQEEGQKFSEFQQSRKEKREKGRPKGSKNKPKNKLDFVKVEEGENTPFGKRGKGRPKGSKNKIKVAEQISQFDENQIKRGRGRPKGAKNKLNSSPDISCNNEESQIHEKKQYERVPEEQIEDIECCSRCNQKILKKKIWEGSIQFNDVLDDIEGICDDFGLENRRNFFLSAIQDGDCETLRNILERKDKKIDFFKPPWQTEKIIEKTRFDIRTKKQYLSKTGKEGIYVLLHDSCYKKQIWWKKIGIERIIESFPRQNPSQVLQVLIEENEDLKEELYHNLPTILRCGKDALASIILKDILVNPSLNKYNYSEEHFDLLDGNYKTFNSLKKFNLIKHNDGSNYCSPIHCAAVTMSQQFLKKVLYLFTDIVKKSDSVFRKPVHYASASRNLDNLKAVVENQNQNYLKELDRKKMTPLMIASSQGLSDNVQFILEKVRDPYYITYRSEQGYSALHYAILRDHIDCVQILLNDSAFERLKEQMKQIVGELFYIVAGTGNVDIFRLLVDKFPSFLSTPFEKYEKFRKTPPMLAIRNHNNELLYLLLEEGCKYTKCDSTQNSLLHYAAAYGNIEVILLLRNLIQQKPNKRGFYPWEIAIMKGHIGCARLLQDHQFQFKKHDPLFLILTNIRGSSEYLQCVKYIEDLFTTDIHYQQQTTGNGYLHLVCGVSEDEYLKIRNQQINMTQEEIREEFNYMQSQFIDFFQARGLDGYLQNKKKESPLKMCIQNINLIGFQKLLTGKINFDIESGDGSTILHRLSNLACRGIQQMEFVEGKFVEAQKSDLRINLKKTDQNGFDFLLYFVKNFTETIKDTFNKWKKQFLKESNSPKESEQKAFSMFIKFEQKFMALVKYLIELGCDKNGFVTDKRNNYLQSYKKWGIQHFLMRFPSLKLIKFFRDKIRDFNAQNNDGMTPLHLFCKNVLDGNLLDAKYIKVPDDYEAQKIITYLLFNGLNTNAKDATRSYPILYAALNHQYKFIMILLQHKSQINFQNLKNQVPFFQIIKNHRNYTLKQIQSFFKYVKPQFSDKQGKTALHHLVNYSSTFDESPQVFKLLINAGFQVNAQDQYKRTPIFYCFDPDDEEKSDEPNDKIELLQEIMKLANINLIIIDMFHRSFVHYACRKNYFFSILHLLDRNINFENEDCQGNTPLGICLKNRNLDQAALIIKKGVRIGFVNDENEKLSYFAYAIKNGQVGICFMLLDNGYPIQRALQEVENDAFKEILKKKYIK